MRDAAPACSLARALACKPRQRRKTRGEKHKERREEPEQSTRRHHEANVARASRASRLRVWWVACSPCSRRTKNGEKNQSKAPGGTTKPTWREHREHQDCECGGSRAALARALRALAGRLELERFVSFERFGSELIQGKAAKTCCAQRRKTRGEKDKERREEPEQSSRRHHEANGATWREHREHEDC